MKVSTKRGIVVALALLFLHTVARSDEEVKPPSGSPATLRSISRAEIANALKTGAIIRTRAIDGSDVAALILASSGSQEQCDARRALRIEKSYIHGDINVAAISQEEATNGNDEQTATAEKGPEPAVWISIPISIKGSSIQGQMTFSRIGFGCPVDFGDSTFDARVNFNRTTFGGRFSADGGVFKREVEVISSEWQGPVTFRGTQFVANAEFFPGSDPTQSKFANDVDFQEASFHRLANFRTSHFEGRTNFQYARFMGEALFDHTAIGAGPKGKFSGPFYMTEFDGRSSFRGATFKGLTFFKTIFRDGVELDGSRGSSLLLMRASIGGRADFSDAKIERLQFQGSMTAEGDVIFRRAQFDDVSFALVVFRKNVDLQGVQIRSKLALRKVSFEGDVHLEDAALPITSSPHDRNQAKHDANAAETDNRFFGIEDTTLNVGLYAEPQQLLIPSPAWEFWKDQKPRFSFVATADPDETADFEGTATETMSEETKELRLWRELRRAFQTSGNLQLQNYAEYRLRGLEENERTGLARFSSIFSRIFWGYSLRPLRVLLWFGVILVSFAGVYWTQLADLYTGHSPVARMWLRARAALLFSLRTAWEVKYGYENSRTSTFRAITLLESALGKLLFACFAYSVSHTSPLLNELLKKLLP